jgi:glucose-6-phosphate 1-dehydrogenase
MMDNKNKKAPCLLFIFGGSGDLNLRKLSPALFNLFIDELMPSKFDIVGLGRTEYSDEAFRDHLYKGIKKFSRRKDNSEATWKKFSEHISYLGFDAKKEEDYKRLDTIVQEKSTTYSSQPIVIFYLAVAPQIVPVIAKQLGKISTCKNIKCTRIVIEKPFGHNLQSAMDLNKLLTGLFSEEQIFRIDHYLGKETVQNILALRFANALFEPLWNKNYIDHIQITVSEEVGVGGRGDYYESSGALRDMVQNHILQLVCMIGMEAPLSFDGNEIRNKKVDVLNALRKIEKDEVHLYAVRGQYKDGWMKGEKVVGYRDEEKVKPKTFTETFAAVKFYIDNWRWQGVPIYVRTGKRMAEKVSRISIQFKPAPNFSFPPEASHTWRPNRLTIGIQPHMDIRLRFQAKRPGNEMILNPVDMIFDYKDAYDGNEPEAYETLLLDVMEGDATLFMRDDQVEASWKVIMPILSAWETRPAIDFPNYAPGTWGPEDAEALIAKDGHNWVTVPDIEKIKKE